MKPEEDGQEGQKEAEVKAKPEKQACESFQGVSSPVKPCRAVARIHLTGGQSTIRLGGQRLREAVGRVKPLHARAGKLTGAQATNQSR
jgi:hypothetical protein